MIKLPIIGITMGDPAGIGPEIIINSLIENNIYHNARPVVIGNADIFIKYKKILNKNININIINDVNKGIYESNNLNIINTGQSYDIKIGTIQKNAGIMAFESIKKACDMALSKKIDAIATAPINKEAFKLANVEHIGHTEAFASICGVNAPLTMFQVKKLRVFFYSRHLSLKDACCAVKKDKLINFIQDCSNSLKTLGINNAKLAVAALNPHCGENGQFGKEEVDEIIPAIEKCKENFNIYGPIAADSVFYQALNGKYDAVISLYHDQGHIATKMVDFERTISITLNLPFIRTSVDHGTAFDISGKNIASSVSMQEAIITAANIVKVNSSYPH